MFQIFFLQDFKKVRRLASKTFWDMNSSHSLFDKDILECVYLFKNQFWDFWKPRAELLLGTLSHLESLCASCCYGNAYTTSMFINLVCANVNRDF